MDLWDNYSNPGAFTSFVTGYHLNHSVVPVGELWRDEEDTDCEPVPSQAVDSGTEDEGGGESAEDEEREEIKGKDMASIRDKEF